MENVTRRTFVEKALKSSVLALSFTLPTGTLLLTPGEARAKDVPLRKLDAALAADLEKLGETIVPGATAAGLTHFLDHQLAGDPNDALLIARYFQVALPYSDFYGAGVQTANAMAQKSAGKGIASLGPAEMVTLVKSMSAPGTVVAGFPVFLFYMCLRSDAVDVVYGTPEGFKKLNIPYMQHIMPPESWNG
jgi:Gluconate 2-dehydrogenase subunit 3